jgi:LCP family protein required for cell wall assembly
MLAVLDPELKTAKLMQIPRDTYVKVPSCGKTKINHAMTYGGSDLMKRTVESWLDIPIHHTLVVDFAGFRKLVDLLGGIPVQVEKNMDYDDPADGTHIHLRKGEQVLNGKQALDFARFRYDPEADTGRMKRQQQVVRAIVHKALSLDNLPKAFRILDILGDHCKTSLSPGEIMMLAKYYYGFDPGTLQTETIKGVNKVAPHDGLWYFFVEKEEQQRLHQLLSNWLTRGNPE